MEVVFLIQGSDLLLRVNGSEVKTPIKFSVGIYDVSTSAVRNADGTMNIDRVGTKRKLEMEWSTLTWSETATLLSAVTDVYFNVTYPDPKTGTYRSIVCYRGDITAPMAIMKNDNPYWKGLKMNWIEQ